MVRRLAKSKALDEKIHSKNRNQRTNNILGAEILDKELGERNQQAGIVTGLAWTPVGGEILLIETSKMQGKKIDLIRTAWRCNERVGYDGFIHLRAHNELTNLSLIITIYIFTFRQAIPKDGPSAGT